MEFTNKTRPFYGRSAEAPSGIAGGSKKPKRHAFGYVGATGWVVATVVCFVSFPQPAHAYIDPGSGSAIISGIIGIFVAAGILIKTYWYKLKSFFGKGEGPQTETKGAKTEVTAKKKNVRTKSGKRT